MNRGAAAVDRTGNISFCFLLNNMFIICRLYCICTDVWSVLSCVHKHLFSVIGPCCINEGFMSEIYFSATCEIKETKPGKKVRHRSNPNIFAGSGSVRVLLLHVDPLRETAKTPMSLPDPSGNQPLQLSSTESGFSSQPPRLWCSCNSRLTLSWPQLVPSTAPSSFEWQVVPTVHHRVLHTFWESRERWVYFLNLLACFSNIHLFPQGILSIEYAVPHSDMQCICCIMNLTQNKWEQSLVNTSSWNFHVVHIRALYMFIYWCSHLSIQSSSIINTDGWSVPSLTKPVSCFEW